MIKIFLIGWFGAGNVGDEAILLTELLAIRNRIKGARFYILSFDKEKTKKLTGEISEVERIIELGAKKRFFRSDFRGLLSAFKNSDAVVIGGGGIFQDLYNYYPVPFFTLMALMARLFRKLLVLHAVGIGPLNKLISRRLCRTAAGLAHMISVRDFESKELLKEIGVNKEIHAAADPVFLLRDLLGEKIERLMDRHKTGKERPTVGICIQNLLSWSRDNKQALAAALDALARERNTRLVFIPFGVYPDGWFRKEDTEPIDVIASKELAGLLKSEHSIMTSHTTPEETMAVIGGLDLVISMRLHGIIMGLSMGVPVLALTYADESKISNLMKRVGREEDVFHVNDLDAEKLLSRLKAVLARNDEFKRDLREKVIHLKREAEKSFELLSGRLSLSPH
ncbi:MAG: polysaccharide pyruvyl transferase family protein [Nitrospirae bacterium]|nr:polysaccharide pyruvyl transferase family protein [Nitrospirota bacterium]